MQEQWKNIPEFDEAYQVSNIGNVRSIGKLESGVRRTIIRKDRLLSKTMDSNGYMQTGLIVNGKQKRLLIHRLVMMAFIGEEIGRPFVNHKNGVKHDNRLENLEWCTKSENAKHSFAIGLQNNKGENHPGHKLTKSQVDEIRLKFIPRKYSSRKLAREYGISKTNVLDIVNNRIW